MSPDQVIERLKSGNARFVEDAADGELQGKERRAELASGQNPWAIILSCADSRVAPELCFDTGLGELFVVRVAGNTANPCAIASIEYAVANLGTKLVVVMGHESCGAVTAAMSDTEFTDNLGILMDYIRPSVAKAETKDVNRAVHFHAKEVARQLVRDSKILADAVQNGVKIVSAYYHLANGAVEFH